MAASLFKRAYTRIVKPTCPNCGADILPDDIQLAAGTMLCRACGHLAYVPLSATDDAVSDWSDVWSPDREPIPQPARTSIRISQSGDELRLRRRTGSVGAGIFLVLWLCGWTVGCVFLIRHAIDEPKAANVLFVIPFVVAWIGVAMILPYQLFGFESLRISSFGLDYSWGALVTLRNRHVPLNSIPREKPFLAPFSTVSDGEGGTRQYALLLATGDRPIHFARGVTRDELLWLADVIRRHVHRIAPALIETTAVVGVGSAASSRKDTASGPVVEVLSPRSPPLDPPAESRVRVRRDTNRTEFVFRPPARSTLGSIGFLAFFVLFWNGIVSVFVWQLIRDFSWFLCLFLVPFVAIGLGMAGLWLVVLSEPFWRHTWTLCFGEIATRFSVFGMGRTRRFVLTGLDRVELRRGRGRKKWIHGQGESEHDDRDCSLVLVNEDGSDLVAFDGLTEEEARWVADELFREFRDRFVRVRM